MNLGQENEYQEFKESLTQLDEGLKSLTAMLNKNNIGTVYFGVNDNGLVNGLEIGKDTLLDIRNKAASFIEPRIVLNFEILEDENKKKYLKVSASGSDTPYSFDGRYFIRVHSSDEKLNNLTLRKLLWSRNEDLITKAPSERQDLTFTGFKQFMSLKGLNIDANNDSNLYRSFDFLNDDGLFNLMAYLLSDQNKISIKVIEFEGIDRTVMSKRTEFGYQCLLLSVSSVQTYLKSINPTKVILSDGERKDIPLFSYNAFHEAWINACVHNDWLSLVPPSISIFDDRLEIVSCGSIPYRLSKKDFYEGVSVPRNNELLRIFINAGFAEQTGHGIPVIVKECGIDSIFINNDIIKITIPFNYENDAVISRKLNESKINNLTKNQIAIKNYLLSHPKATLEEVSIALSLSLSGVKKTVKKLQELNLIKRIGTKRDGYYSE